MSSDDDSLWHYTSLSGFLGILKDQEIWVTDIRFLNDASELYHFLDRMGQTMKGETAKYGEWDYYLKHWLSFKPLMGGLSFLGVACFSGRKDDLSQWRGYTAVGQGVALRFDRVRLDSLAKAAGYQLIQCNYDELDSQKAIDEVLGRVRHAKPAEAGQPQRGAFSPAEAIALNLGGLLLTLAAQRKDPKFESEQEVRLISPRMGAAAHFDSVGNQLALDFRAGGNTLIPFTRFPIEDQNGSLITGATVGPTPHPDIAKGAIYTALRQHGLHNVDLDYVTSSEVPYRKV